jgi:MFS family permease
MFRDARGRTLPRGPLRSRNFRLLLTSNVASTVGTAVSFVALPFAVLRIGGSASDVGYVVTAELVPLIAFLLLGGVIADRLPRHQVIVAANALQALAQGASAALVLTGYARVWQLAVLAAAGGIGTGFYYPAASGLLPQTVPADQRPQANALDRTGRNSATIGGSALGGLLIGLAGPGWGLAIDAASFAVAGLLRIGMRFPAPPSEPQLSEPQLSEPQLSEPQLSEPQPSEPSEPSPSMLHDLREGWREFTSRRWLWITVTQFAFLVAVSAATTSVLGPLVAHTRLGGPRSWGLIVAAYSAGAVAGGLVMIKFRPRRILVAAMLSVPAFSLLLFALAVPLATPVDVAAAVLAGGCLEVFNVSWDTTLQQEISPDKLSRVASYEALGAYALTPVGTVVAGPLATAFGIRAIFAASGVLIAVLPVLVLLVPEVRHMRRT